ncbi:hypothetical protein AB0E69_17805 [Kribbella sp. NPDC026611]|uniref:hypothetical protein n=1 Tax=Kribbella sp. NPDC026611 TaxID=3154911 RepID=UPI0033CF9D5B
MDLNAYYAEQKRRREVAEQEFAARADTWRFTLAPEAQDWAADWPAITEANLLQLVLQADAAGLFLTAEAGSVRSAYSYRDQYTEATTATGFGFWPETAEYLVVHAAQAIMYDELPGLDAFGVLRRVADTFQQPAAGYEQS